MILEDYIRQNAERYPDKPAIVCNGQECSYSELERRIEQCAGDMAEGDVSSPPVVPIRAMSTIDYLVTYFALHRRGCAVAPLEHDIPDGQFQAIADKLKTASVPEGTADVLFTTGTTGQSKGVIISHKTILADAENLIDGQGFTHQLAFVVSGPLNHIGSLSKVYPVMMLGATLIIVDGMKDVGKFFDAFNYNAPSAQKFATFLVPASIRMLLQFSEDKLAACARKIDFIETGAAAIPQADIDKLCHLLPNSRLYNTYASTETGIICTHDFNHGERQAGCLGRPMRHSQVFITSEGLIACKGDTLMTGYFGDPEKTADILKDGTIYTSDVGNIDSEGRLHLTGRQGDVINVGGFKVAPTEVENAAMAFPDIADCVCVSADHPIVGRALKLLVVMKEGAAFNKRSIALHLKTRLETYKIPLLYEQVESVKRTFNGKIDRKYYI